MSLLTTNIALNRQHAVVIKNIYGLSNASIGKDSFCIHLQSHLDEVTSLESEDICEVTCLASSLSWLLREERNLTKVVILLQVLNKSLRFLMNNAYLA